jgi:hypothetical protein
MAEAGVATAVGTTAAVAVVRARMGSLASLLKFAVNTPA